MMDDMEQTVFRRGRHVVTEIERVQEAVQALEIADFKRLGELMNESHRSLTLDYEVSSPRMDDLAETVRRVPGVYGARLTGAGFGGCVVAVGEKDSASAIEAAVRARYDPKYGVVAPVWSVRPSAGAEVKRIEI
jgi:galactokinase